MLEIRITTGSTRPNRKSTKIAKELKKNEQLNDKTTHTNQHLKAQDYFLSCILFKELLDNTNLRLKQRD